LGQEDVKLPSTPQAWAIHLSQLVKIFHDAHGLDPDEHWQLADAIRCALTDVEFEATFGSDNPTLEIAE
jgi:hypothetical protein